MLNMTREMRYHNVVNDETINPNRIYHYNGYYNLIKTCKHNKEMLKLCVESGHARCVKLIILYVHNTINYDYLRNAIITSRDIVVVKNVFQYLTPVWNDLLTYMTMILRFRQVTVLRYFLKTFPDFKIITDTLLTWSIAYKDIQPVIVKTILDAGTNPNYNGVPYIIDVLIEHRRPDLLKMLDTYGYEITQQEMMISQSVWK
jgi:hypothetical protein